MRTCAATWRGNSAASGSFPTTRTVSRRSTRGWDHHGRQPPRARHFILPCNTFTVTPFHHHPRHFLLITLAIPSSPLSSPASSSSSSSPPSSSSITIIICVPVVSVDISPQVICSSYSPSQSHAPLFISHSRPTRIVPFLFATCSGRQY